MNNLIIRIVADALTGTKKPIKPEDNLKARKIIADALKDYQLFPWNVEDIKDSRHAKKAKPRLTKDECREIPETIAHRFDAGIGVNWDVINEHVWQYLQAREPKEKTRG